MQPVEHFLAPCGKADRGTGKYAPVDGTVATAANVEPAAVTATHLCTLTSQTHWRTCRVGSWSTQMGLLQGSRPRAGRCPGCTLRSSHHPRWQFPGRSRRGIQGAAMAAERRVAVARAEVVVAVERAMARAGA